MWSTYMTGSRFHEALEAHQTNEVGMNEVQFRPFLPNGIRAIGTRNLNGCTTVAIVSTLGAILAHIPPLPYPTTDPHAGMQNVREKMMEVVAYYQQNQAFFPPERSSLVVGAVYGNDLALPEQLHIVRGILRHYKVVSDVEFYRVTAGGHPTPAQGTVFIDARQGSPLVYVEDRLVPLLDA